MTGLQFFKEEDLSGVSYDLFEIQQRYTSSATAALKRVADRNTGLEFPVTIFDNGAAAGFFTLDFGDDKMEFTDNPNAVLLRSLSVNPAMQGRGSGKSAMEETVRFVKEHFKSCDEIVLSVNHDNQYAYELYLKVGYRYEGKTRMGRSGLQYLMNKQL